MLLRAVYLWFCLVTVTVHAWTGPTPRRQAPLQLQRNQQHGTESIHKSSCASESKQEEPFLSQDPHALESSLQSRRQLLTAALTTATTTASLATTTMGWWSARPAHAAVTRAVGSGEEACRAAGNCLEIGEWDGAVGWSWGGKDRCDPANPLCGADGKLRDAPYQGQPVPQIDTAAISHVAALEIAIGRDETGILRFGLYGDAYPDHVAQFLDFLSTSGLTSQSSSSSSSSFASFSAATVPVSLARAGSSGQVTNIVPGTAVVIGIPSQSLAYAKAVGSSKVLDGFVPQPPPEPSLQVPSAVPRIPHDVAGLLSVPEQGLGYGGNGFEPNDEIFNDAFWVTAAALPSSLSKKRLVIGQVLDAASMAFLERLANVPTQRGIRGVIPGQTSGPPLKKITIRSVEVATVVNRPNSSSS